MTVFSCARKKLRKNRDLFNRIRLKGVTKIEKQAFSGDKKLKTVKINANKLKSIGANAFAGATKKTKFIIFAKNKKIFNKWVKRLKKVGAKKSKFSFKKKK